MKRRKEWRHERERDKARAAWFTRAKTTLVPRFGLDPALPYRFIFNPITNSYMYRVFKYKTKYLKEINEEKIQKREGMI